MRLPLHPDAQKEESCLLRFEVVFFPGQKQANPKQNLAKQEAILLSANEQNFHSENLQFPRVIKKLKNEVLCKVRREKRKTSGGHRGRHGKK